MTPEAFTITRGTSALATLLDYFFASLAMRSAFNRS